MLVNWTFINPGKINTQKIRGQIQTANLNAAKRWIKMLNMYTATWDHQPDWKKVGGYRGGYLFVGVTTDDDVFWYLELGTWDRYATMTEDFEPKTAPGQIKSVAGNGTVAYINPRIPRNGIEPRHILEEIGNADIIHWERDIEKIFANIHFVGGETHIG